MPKFFLVAFAFTIVSSVFAQDYEYGKPEDLRGLKTVFVDTGGVIKDRDRIIMMLDKFGSGLTVVDDAEDAEIRIVFSKSRSTQAYTRTIPAVPGTPTSPISVPGRVDFVVGEAIVTINGKTPGARRVVMNFEGGKRDPVAKFTKEFVKVYKKVNGIE